jgi:hypothetical protein
VFEPFRQADASITRTSGGVGLGLALVRHLVEAHGGSVSVWSPGPRLGTTFEVTLPVQGVKGDAMMPPLDLAARVEPPAVATRPAHRSAAKASSLS